MQKEHFIYWLQGFAELNPEAPTTEQWQAIRDHLATVFDKQTPSYTFGETSSNSDKNGLTPNDWPQSPIVIC